MALDKLVDSTQLDSDLTSVANAIRTKGGTSASLAFPAGFVSAIGDIPSGGDEWALYLDEYDWEVGAVGGQTNKTYEENKTTNANRLRTVNLIKTANIPFTLTCDWAGGEWVMQFQPYNSSLKSTSAFTVISSDTDIPITPYLAVVIRHNNGDLPMYVSDVQTIKPKLFVDKESLGILFGGE